MQNTLIFAKIDESMLNACEKIAAAAPDPWQKQHFARAILCKNHRCFAAVLGAQPVGLACFLALGDSADLEIVATEPMHRRTGVAKSLLCHSFAALKNQGVKRVLLELRASNTGAMALYKNLGFAILAKRPGMYQNPKENGVLMALNLCESAVL